MNQRFLLLLFLAATTIQQAAIAQATVGTIKIVSSFRIYLSAVFYDKASLAFNQIEFITLAHPDVFSYLGLLVVVLISPKTLKTSPQSNSSL